MEGPRIRVCMGSGKSTCAVRAVGIVSCAHIALKAPHTAGLTGGDSWTIRTLKAGQ